MGFKQQGTILFILTNSFPDKPFQKLHIVQSFWTLFLSYQITSKPTGQFQPKDVWKTEVPNQKYIEIFFEDGFRLDGKDLFLTKGKIEPSH